MGSEGYLINQFVAPRTNHRDDEWGGAFENRIRFPVEIVRARARSGRARTSSSSTGCRCSTWSKAAARGTRSSRSRKAVEAAGATIINTGIGWHEARIPTIATMVPRAAFAWVTRRLKGEVRIPLITTNRINDPATAEALLARGDADMVSMARPFLADAEFVDKAAAGRADEINTCIALQPGLPRPHLRAQDRDAASSIRTPCRETELVIAARRARKRVAVVGAGPAGLACATTAAERGHAVTLFDAAAEIGGQFNLAKRIPGKEEFAETLRYFRARLAQARRRRCARRGASTRDDLRGFDARGARDRHRAAHAGDPGHRPSEGRELRRRSSTGRRVGRATRGDRSAPAASASTSREFLTAGDAPDGHVSDGRVDDPAIVAFRDEWGIDAEYRERGGVMPAARCRVRRARSGCCSARRRRSARDSRRRPAGSGARCSSSAA